MDKFIPDDQTLSPIGDLMSKLSLTPDVVKDIIQIFVDNSPVPELANLVLAETEDVP